MPADLVKFGDGFELDRNSYQLRRDGIALKLERIPLDILLLLVERTGQLVSREEIIAKIWGKDVFLDTDSSINGAIRKIRQVLKDDREIPVFVQTVTGKGYRFIAAVTEVDTSGPQEDALKKNEASNIIVQEGSASLATRTERRIFLRSWPGPPRWQLRQDGG
jgi:DNA-binding winged helix-turn-helix (wHTH) protein